MKQLKPLKIFVPVSYVVTKDFVEENNIRLNIDFKCATIYTRQEIHELIQKKAIELGYDKYSEWKSDSDGIIFNSDSVVTFVYFVNDKSNEFFHNISNQEIFWQDFMKFTPEDVQEPNLTSDVPEGFVPDEPMRDGPTPVLPSNDDYLHRINLNKKVNDERKELAEKILLKLIEARHSDIDLDEFIAEGGCKTHVTIAINYADEFLKQIINRDWPPHV